MVQKRLHKVYTIFFLVFSFTKLPNKHLRRFKVFLTFIMFKVEQTQHCFNVHLMSISFKNKQATLFQHPSDVHEVNKQTTLFQHPSDVHEVNKQTTLFQRRSDANNISNNKQTTIN